jgi:DNA repair photolyase
MVDEVFVKTILNKHKKRDDWFLDDYSVNPYPGCAFNCVYCYIKGSKYGINIPKTPSVKINAPTILDKQLKRRAKKNEYGIIAFASQEAYPPLEERYEVTRKMLSVILRKRFPVHIITKSTLIVRDLDLLKEIDGKAILPDDLKESLGRGVIISFSFSTLDNKLARILEPGAPSAGERLDALRRCKEDGFLVGVNFIPVLPFISDTDEQLEDMVKTVSEYGAMFAFLGGLTLFGDGPHDCRTLYFAFLEQHYPGLLPKYEELFKKYPSPPGKYQKNLEEKGKRYCRKYGMRYGIVGFA